MKFTFTCKKISLNDSVKAYAEKRSASWRSILRRNPKQL